MHSLLSFGLIALIQTWSPSVHNTLLEQAFPDVSLDCLLSMQSGSADADADRYQNVEFSYMHAMRRKGQDPKIAAKAMYQFIVENYAEAKRTSNEEQHCYYRGFALHPIMDSTSPAHVNFQEWDAFPYGTIGDLFQALLNFKGSKAKLPKMLEHGDFAADFKRKTGITIGETLEDEEHAKQNPKLINETIELMRMIDKVYLL